MPAPSPPVSSNPNGVLERALAPHAGLAYRVLCLLTGLLFAFHGAQKVFGWFLPPGVEVPLVSQAGIGGVIELVTGLAIALGVKTTWAAFLASGTMAVAYIQFHWKLAFGAAFLPAVNGGELALVYCFLFLYIACRGGRPLWSDGRA